MIIYSVPVGMHHLFMDPEHSTGFKFIQTALTALVAVPTLTTVFTISASLELAGRLRGGKGLFGWIGALPWERPMVLATGLAFVMLFFGGGGGLVNMSYGMNAMVHNTSWVTGHFHLIFGGTVVIMYMAIAYEIWPTLTGRAGAPTVRQRVQLWLWAVGMMIMTVPWHYLGLQGQWRRVAAFDYSDPRIAPWGPWVVVSLVGGVILLASAFLFIANLLDRRQVLEPASRYAFALPVHRLTHVPAALNGFALWNICLAVLMLVAFGFPILQFFMGRRPGPHPSARRGLTLPKPIWPPDRWSLWAGVIIAGVLVFSVGFGLVVMPILQAPGAGIDPWTAICRAMGIKPGTPGAPQPPVSALAQPVSQVRWTSKTLTVLAAADPRPGAALAQSLCSACHGDAGRSPSPLYPHLSGQSAEAIFKQLSDFRSGARVNPMMTPVAKGMTEDQLVQVAAYYAHYTREQVLGAQYSRPTRGFRDSAHRGDPSRQIPPCEACHARDVGGPPEAPVLWGRRPTT